MDKEVIVKTRLRKLTPDSSAGQFENHGTRGMSWRENASFPRLHSSIFRIRHATYGTQGTEGTGESRLNPFSLVYRFDSFFSTLSKATASQKAPRFTAPQLPRFSSGGVRYPPRTLRSQGLCARTQTGARFLVARKKRNSRADGCPRGCAGSNGGYFFSPRHGLPGSGNWLSAYCGIATSLPSASYFSKSAGVGTQSML